MCALTKSVEALTYSRCCAIFTLTIPKSFCTIYQSHHPKHQSSAILSAIHFCTHPQRQCCISAQSTNLLQPLQPASVVCHVLAWNLFQITGIIQGRAIKSEGQKPIPTDHKRAPRNKLHSLLLQTCSESLNQHIRTCLFQSITMLLYAETTVRRHPF
jgi:hypothetical protein